MTSPPPPPKLRAAPPPPPPRRTAAKTTAAPFPPPEPEDPPPISPDLTRFDLEAAVWIHGGYPQVPWPDAVRNLLRKCRETSLGQINAAAIRILDQRLPFDCDLTFDRSSNIVESFTVSATDEPILNQPIKGLLKR